MEAPEEDRCDETEARRRVLTAALDQLSAAAGFARQFGACAALRPPAGALKNCDETQAGPDPENALYRETIRTQRTALVDLRDKGNITDELLRKLERELDLEESRIPG